jgi:hypothetical protein
MPEFQMHAHMYKPPPEDPIVKLGEFWKVGQPLFVLLVVAFVAMLAFVYFYKRDVKVKD